MKETLVSEKLTVKLHAIESLEDIDQLDIGGGRKVGAT
jgi:hypothetical protein